MNLLGETEGGNNRGAILVTPNVGAHDVVIHGPGFFNRDLWWGSLTLHQYNINAALVIHAPIYNLEAAHLVKTGPGEVVLTSPLSSFARLSLLEGTLTVTNMPNPNTTSPMGMGSLWGTPYRFVLGDATLRYTGAGQSTDRQFTLRGFGIVETSGAGPLTFTHNEPVVTPGSYSRNQLLTLSGTGEGVIEGSLNNLKGGRLRKRGSGTWTLNGESPNIIWGAEIFDGTLVVNGTLGRDVTVHTNGTLAGKGLVKRDLYLKDGGTLALDPDAVLTVGKNLYLADDARITLPRKLPGVFVPVLKVNGKVEGSFTPPSHAYWKYDETNKTFLVKFRPTGTLLVVR